MHGGLRWALPDDSSGTLRIRASAQLQLFAFDLASGIDRAQELRVELRIGDALGWLASTPELELRALSAVLTLPLDGHSPGEARVVLHEARVFGQSWEALALGNLADDAVPCCPRRACCSRRRCSGSPPTWAASARWRCRISWPPSA